MIVLIVGAQLIFAIFSSFVCWCSSISTFKSFLKRLTKSARNPKKLIHTLHLN
jgi:hypothetical protein